MSSYYNLKRIKTNINQIIVQLDLNFNLCEAQKRAGKTKTIFYHTYRTNLVIFSVKQYEKIKFSLSYSKLPFQNTKVVKKPKKYLSYNT